MKTHEQMKTYDIYTNQDFEPITIINGEHVSLEAIQDKYFLMSNDEFMNILKTEFEEETVKEILWMVDNKDNYELKSISDPTQK